MAASLTGGYSRKTSSHAVSLSTSSGRGIGVTASVGDDRNRVPWNIEYAGARAVFAISRARESRHEGSGTAACTADQPFMPLVFRGLAEELRTCWCCGFRRLSIAPPIRASPFGWLSWREIAETRTCHCAIRQFTTNGWLSPPEPPAQPQDALCELLDFGVAQAC